MPKQDLKTKEEAAKKGQENAAEAEITTVETEAEEIEKTEEDQRKMTTAGDATALVIGLHRVPNAEIAVGAKNAMRTDEKADALNVEEEVTNNVTAGDDPLAHRDPTTRAIDETEDHVAEVDLQAELQKDTQDAADTIKELDLIPQTAVAMTDTIDTIDVVVEEEDLLSTGEAVSTIEVVLVADLFLILVRAPPDHPQGKRLANKGNTPKAAADAATTAEVKANNARANITTRGLIPRAKISRATGNRKTTKRTTP